MIRGDLHRRRRAWKGRDRLASVPVQTNHATRIRARKRREPGPPSSPELLPRRPPTCSPTAPPARSGSNGKYAPPCLQDPQHRHHHVRRPGQAHPHQRLRPHSHAHQVPGQPCSPSTPARRTSDSHPPPPQPRDSGPSAALSLEQLMRCTRPARAGSGGGVPRSKDHAGPAHARLSSGSSAIGACGFRPPQPARKVRYWRSRPRGRSRGRVHLGVENPPAFARGSSARARASLAVRVPPRDRSVEVTRWTDCRAGSSPFPPFNPVVGAGLPRQGGSRGYGPRPRAVSCGRRPALGDQRWA